MVARFLVGGGLLDNGGATLSGLYRQQFNMWRTPTTIMERLAANVRYTPDGEQGPAPGSHV
jgi:hypothetical protein